MGGSPFGLSGIFSTVATNVDYDPDSPHYGDLSGFFPASGFQIQGSGTGGNFTLSLSGDQPWTVNLGPAWTPDAGDKLAGFPVTFTAVLSGILTSSGGSTPFTGTATGNVIFFASNAETINATFALTSGIGPLTGALNAAGVSTVTPEPASLFLCGAVLGGLIIVRTRRTDKLRAGLLSGYKKDRAREI